MFGVNIFNSLEFVDQYEGVGFVATGAPQVHYLSLGCKNNFFAKRLLESTIKFDFFDIHKYLFVKTPGGQKFVSTKKYASTHQPFWSLKSSVPSGIKNMVGGGKKLFDE